MTESDSRTFEKGTYEQPAHAVITGDVISSRKHEQALWSSKLKSVLATVGEEGAVWEIFRGDAFQLFVEQPAEAFHTALCIRAGFKSVKGLDLRMAIGLGKVTNREPRVGESNGSAFVYSGALVDELESMHVNLALRSGNHLLDDDINAGLAMASALMDRWLPNYASSVAGALAYPEYNQMALGEALGIAQNTVSERLNRANYKVLMNFDQYFRRHIKAYAERK